METLEERLRRVVAEAIEVVPYDPRWPSLFEEEAQRLRALVPAGLIGRIEHMGSTAVPGLAAKPIIDMLVEVRSLAETRQRIAPLLEANGYDYFWRPTWGDDTPPWYAWFIRRDTQGRRTHHIHMVESHFPHWERLRFRDHLVAHPRVAKEYAELKLRLCATLGSDRVAYTAAKGEFIGRVMDSVQ